MNRLFRRSRRHHHRGDRLNSGFTLIELLIAILVMMIGLLGVLSMFPVSIDLVRKSAEFSEASVLSSSFHQSLASGFHRSRTVEVSPGGTTYTVVTVNHAGLLNRGDSTNQTEKYTFFAPSPPSSGPVNSFFLPCPQSDWGSNSPCPDADPNLSSKGVSWGYGGTGSETADPKQEYIWQLGQFDDSDFSSVDVKNDLYDLIRDIRGEGGGIPFDPSFRLDRYSFSVLIRKRKKSAWPAGFYQVLIRVYHNFRNDNKVPRTMGEGHRNLVRKYGTMISK